MREQNTRRRFLTHTRRRFLTLVSAGAGTVLTGCLGGGSDPEPTSETTTVATETGTQTESTDTESTTDEETTTDEPESMSTVFHFSSADESTQKHATANVKNLIAADLNVEDVVLVANGRGIHMLTTEHSAVASEVKRLIDDGAAFRACENSMSALGVTQSDLIDGVETVPAGVGELTKLQSKGYAYIETP